MIQNLILTFKLFSLKKKTFKLSVQLILYKSLYIYLTKIKCTLIVIDFKLQDQLMHGGVRVLVLIEFDRI